MDQISFLHILKIPISANLQYFWPWRSSEGPKGLDLVPTATGWSGWVNYIHIMCSGPLWDLYGTPGASKRAHFGPERPFWEPRRSSVGPGVQIWSQLPPFGPLGLDSWLPHTLAWYRASSR